MRPRLAEKEESEVVTLRVPRSDRERFERAARLNFQTFSAFARDALAEAASDTLDEDDPDRDL